MPCAAAARDQPWRMSNLPLLLTTDESLLDELLRVSSAAGADLYASDTGPDAAVRWTSAPIVLIGHDAVARVVALGLPRRSDVIVVAPAPGGDDPALWRSAVAVGAEHVALLPEGERWLAERLADACDTPATPAKVVTVVSGRGGAGASTYALLLGRAHAGESLLVDLDPLGGGIDLRSELDETAGLRWPDLAAVSGRLSSAALRGALPHEGRMAVVSAVPHDPQPVPVEAFAAVLDAAIRGGGLTILDTPRDLSAVARLAWARSDLAVVIAPDDQGALPATRALVDAVSASGTRVVAVLRRGRDQGVHRDDLEGFLGIAVVAEWRHDRALARGDAIGRGPTRTWRSITDPVLDLVTASARRHVA